MCVSRRHHSGALGSPAPLPPHQYSLDSAVCRSAILGWAAGHPHPSCVCGCHRWGKAWAAGKAGLREEASASVLSPWQGGQKQRCQALADRHRGLGPACPKVLAFPRPPPPPSHTGPVTHARSEGTKAWPEPQSDIPNWGGCELWELRPRIPFQGPQLQSPHSVPTRTPPPTSPCYLLL